MALLPREVPSATPSTPSMHSPEVRPYWPGRNVFDTPLGDSLRAEIYRGREYAKVYMLSFAAFFLITVVIHWSAKLQTWRKSKAHKQLFLPLHRRNSNKSDKSSISEITKSSVATSAESTPLLQHQRPAKPSQLNPFQRVSIYLSGYLMIQPQGRYTEYLEPHSTTLALAYYYISTIIFISYRYTHPIVLAFRFGLLCVVNIPPLYIFGAKHSPLSFLTGCSYEQINVYHRHVGRVCVAALIAHTALFLLYFRPLYLLSRFWSIMGITAGTCFVVIGVSSVRPLRQRFYEIFYYIHFVGMLIALPTIYFHFPTIPPFAIVAGLSVAYDRIVRLFDYRLVWCKVEVHVGDTVIIRVPKRGSKLVDGTTGSKYNPFVWLLRCFQRPLQWDSGQHIFVTLPTCGLLESHPFTIASSSALSDTLDVIIRARDGFTRKILEQERANPTSGRWVILHGPYGVHPVGMPVPEFVTGCTTGCTTCLGNLENCSNSGLYNKNKGTSKSKSRKAPTKAPKRHKIVLVAGGAGVAFTYPLYEEYKLAIEQSPRAPKAKSPQAVLKKKLVDWKRKCDEESNTGTRSGGSSSSKSNSGDATPKEESVATPAVPLSSGPSSAKHKTIDEFDDDLDEEDEIELEFLWIVPYNDFLSWIPNLDSQMMSRAFSPESPRVRTRIWATREDGRPNIRHEVQSMIGPAPKSTYSVLGGQETLDDTECRKCWVATCGPDFLVREVRNACAELRMAGRDDVEFYAEKFGW